MNRTKRTYPSKTYARKTYQSKAYPQKPHPIRNAQTAGYDAGVKAKTNPGTAEKRRRGASRRMAFLLGFLRGANPGRRPAYNQSQRRSFTRKSSNKRY